MSAMTTTTAAAVAQSALRASSAAVASAFAPQGRPTAMAPAR